jgi:uncharacterized protein YpmB
MKRKFIVIIMTVVIMALIVTFSMIGCKNTINSRPAATTATTTATTAKSS